jgi:F420-non-reducing hydrogenase iron-sulfur subunit
MNKSNAAIAPGPVTWQPKIAAFFCNWCTYTAADLAGVSRLKYAANIRVIRLMCSGRVDPQFVLEAFARGADGVLIGGCHPGDCHYVEGNYKMLRRFHMLKRLLQDMGVEESRFRLEWISASEGEKVRTVVNDMVRQLIPLGPLNLPGRVGEWDKEMATLEQAVHETETTACAAGSSSEAASAGSAVTSTALSL